MDLRLGCHQRTGKVVMLLVASCLYDNVQSRGGGGGESIDVVLS